MTATKMTRKDELPRHLIPDSEWPRFLQATVADWTTILNTSAVTIISPSAAKDIRKHLHHRIVPSRHVYREKPGEGVGAASKAKCRWCVRGHRDPDIRHLEGSSSTPQTSSKKHFPVLLRQFTSGKALWEISSQRLRKVTRMFRIDQGANCMRAFHLVASRFLTERGSRKVP